MSEIIKSVSESDLRKSYKDFCNARERTVADGQEAIGKAIAFGKLLYEKKEQIKHGEFGPLLEKIGVSASEASRLMRLANLPLVASLNDCDSLKDAYYATGILVKSEPAQLTNGSAGNGEQRAEQTFLRPIQSCCHWFAAHPITEQTPIEDKRIVYKELQPIAELYARLAADIAASESGSFKAP